MTPLTPQQVAFETQLEQSPEFSRLKEVDQEIIADLEGLKIGQTALGAFVSEGFTKGKDRMDGLETMFKDHINTTKDNHRETMSAYTDLKTEIRDNKFKDLQGDNKALRDEIEERKKRKWDILKIIISGLVSLLVGGLAVRFFG